MAYKNPLAGAAREAPLAANTRVYTNAGAPVDGTSGTLKGIAGKGSILTDTTNGIVYVNTNTLASPTWTKVGTQT